MTGSLGTAVLTLETDNARLKRGLDDGERDASGWGGRIGGIAKTAILGLTGVAALGVGLSIKAAADAEKVSAQTAAVLASTHGVAGVTNQAVMDLATSLSRVTPFEDDVVQATENMLLTFTSIGKDVFPRATETALNMATALGEDTQAAAIQLGKAMNDPITGATALRRVGVALTEQQMEQIKVMQESGDLMGAQKVILDELSIEFGGAARAAGQTFAGQLSILKGQIGNVGEAIGGPLIGALTGLLTKVMPGLEAFADRLPAMMETAGARIGDVVGVFSDLFGIISGKAPDAGVSLRAVFGEDLGEKIAAVTGLLRQAKDLIVGAFNGITYEADGLDESWTHLFGVGMPKPLYDFVNLTTTTLTGFVGAIKKLLGGDVGGALGDAITLWGNFRNGVITLIVDALPQILSTFNGWAKAAVEWVTMKAIPQLQAALPGILTSLLGFVIGSVDKVVDALLAFGKAFYEWVVPAIPPLLNAALGLLSTLLTWLGDHAEEIGTKLIEWGMKFGEFILTTAIPAIARTLPGVLLTIGTWVLTEAIPGVLRIFIGLGKGIISGILSGLGSLKTEVGNAIGSAIQSAFEAIDLQVGPFHISGRGGVSFSMPAFNIPNPFAGGGTTTSSAGPASSSSSFTANLYLDGDQIATAVGDRTTASARMAGAGF